jgi:hypothetical protein
MGQTRESVVHTVPRFIMKNPALVCAALRPVSLSN